MPKRICWMCHKPTTRKLCRTCEKVKGYHDVQEQVRLAELAKKGWVPPPVETIRNK